MVLACRNSTLKIDKVEGACRKGALFSMGPLPDFTGNQLKDQLLLLLVTCGQARRDDLACLHASPKYISKVITDLRNARIIATTKDRPSTITLAPRGIELIQAASQVAYQHYARTTNNFHPGSTSRHTAIKTKASGLVALMEGAGVCVGPENPPLEAVTAGKQEKLSPETRAFYLNKELKYSDEQKVTRPQMSRSSGVIISRGLMGLAFNVVDTKLQLNRKSELEATMRVARYVQDLYQEHNKFTTRDNIITCNVTGNEHKLFVPQKKATSGRMTIGDAIWNKAITGAAYRYIPKTIEGAKLLHLITTTTREEFLQIAFQEDERSEAYQRGIGEAFIKNLCCYEYLSCNISKLAYIKRTHEDLSGVGIVCWDCQRDFIIQFMESNKLRFRPLELAAYNQEEGDDC